MDEIRIFENPEFGSVRTVEVNGEPYFVATDICNALNLSNTTVALDRLDADEKSKLNLGLSGGATNCVNECGLYTLIMASRKPTAKEFKRWVTHEVLPSIRKHGAYMTEQTIEKALTSPDFLIELATKLKEEQEKRKQLEVKVAQDKPLVDFATQVSKSSDLIDIAQMAKLAQDENINIGRNKLFEWLREKKILMNNNNPYQRFVDQGFFQLKEVTKNTPYGDKIFLKTLVTGKGQIYIIQKLKDEY